MKKYIIGFFTASVLLSGCTPEVEELRTIRKEELKKPKTDAPSVDLTKTVVIFKTKETSGELYRDPDTFLIGEANYSFAPDFTKRILEEGETIKLKLVPKQDVNTQAITIKKGEITSGANQMFEVALKADAFKDTQKYQVGKEYTFSFGVEVVEAMPANLPIAGVEDAVYQIKVKLTDSNFPEGDNIEETYEIPEAEDPLSNFTFSSNYKPDHLHKLTDGNSFGNNWWIDTDITSIFLKATFDKPTLVRGFVIYTADALAGSGSNLGGMNVAVSAVQGGKTKTYQQGKYAPRYTSGGELIFKFKKPVEITEIQFDNFKKGGNRYINIYEIEFY
ncbi:hypothetical protein [Capnocytophaga sp.]|uniref:hypothetical protein n=1 Tax=Capnocytophaga sp. TaxID=44737 RepID=UPI0026DB74CF|nr:hypothetical protein [Capnocytophaga sp.]MDO5105975.1 hypothetical protein [Capnocytophaga sp.]